MTTIGLDIGTTGLRAVELERRKDGTARLKRWASVPLPNGVVTSARIEDPRALRSAIRALWRRGKFSSRDVVVGLNDAGIITRQVDLPWMPEKDFASALRYQVTDVLPVETAQVELGYHPIEVIPTTDDAGQPLDLMRVLLVATDRGSLIDRANVLRSARLVPKRADLSSFALIQLRCEGTDWRHTAGAEAIVDIGADLVTVIVHAGGQPRFIRAVADHAGRELTTDLAERLDVSESEADAVKARFGVNAPVQIVAPIIESPVFGQTGIATLPSIDPIAEAASEVASPWAAGLIAQVRNSIDYYHASSGGTLVARIALTGGSAQMPGLASRISEELRLPVDIIDPLAHLQPPRSRRARAHLPSPAGAFAVAAGLALGSQS